MRVYLDSLLLHSTILDALLLLLLARLFRLPLPRWRLFVGTLLAVGHVVTELFLPQSVVVFLRLLWPVAIVAGAFGLLPGQRVLWLWCGWHLCAAATAGLGRSLGQLFLPLVGKLGGSMIFPSWLPALLLLIGIRAVPAIVDLWRRRLKSGANIFQVEIDTAFGAVRLNALWDSGNLLRVSEDDLPVLIMHHHYLPALRDVTETTPEVVQARAVALGVSSLELRKVAYRGLGSEAIELTVMRPSKVYVRNASTNTELKCWLGLSDDPLLGQEAFQAILPAVWVERETTTIGGKRRADTAIH